MEEQTGESQQDKDARRRSPEKWIHHANPPGDIHYYIFSFQSLDLGLSVLLMTRTISHLKKVNILIKNIIVATFHFLTKFQMEKSDNVAFKIVCEKNNISTFSTGGGGQLKNVREKIKIRMSEMVLSKNKILFCFQKQIK